MTLLSTQTPFTPYTDLDGTPLDSGYVYFGAANQNPETAAITVYWDAAGLIPAAQPIRTSGGFAVNNGRLAHIYSSTDYSITVKDKYGRLVYSSPTSSEYSNDFTIASDLSTAISTLRADLANTSDITKGDALLGAKLHLTGAVGRTQDAVNAEIVSVMAFGAVGDGIADDTNAIQDAINSLPKFGAAGWRPCELVFPMPPNHYKITAPLLIQNHQGLIIRGCGSQIEGNFANIMLQIGDLSGSNDVLRLHVDNLTVVQNSTVANSGAVRAQHLYESSFKGCYFYGGRIAYSLDGNANVHVACTFRGAQDSNVRTGSQSNNETNDFYGCSNELSAGLGYDLSVPSGVGGYTKIIGGYCEANAGGNIECTNTQKTIVDGVYFNLQNNASAVILGGTVGPSYADPQVTVRNCRVLGSGTGTPKFIEELSATAVNARYSGNTLEGGACSMYGSAQASINDDRRRDMVYVSNADSFAGGPPPTGWTLSGPGPTATAASVSPYGSAAAVKISGVSYLKQVLAFPTNALLRVSCWASGNGATMQLWDSAVGSQFTGASSGSTSGASTRLEFYVPSTARASAAAGALLLRNLTGGGTDAYFSNLVIEDMTN